MNKVNKNTLIDNKKFAETGQKIIATVQLNELENLITHLCDSYYLQQSDLKTTENKQVNFTLLGYVDNSKKEYLSLDCQLKLLLPCQRCLQNLEYDLDFRRDYLLVRAGLLESELEHNIIGDFSEDYEFLEYNHALNVLNFLEEEIILSLPLVPKHENCQITKEKSDNSASSPFAVLRNLV